MSNQASDWWWTIQKRSRMHEWLWAPWCVSRSSHRVANKECSKPIPWSTLSNSFKSKSYSELINMIQIIQYFCFYCLFVLLQMPATHSFDHVTKFQNTAMGRSVPEAIGLRHQCVFWPIKSGWNFEICGQRNLELGPLHKMTCWWVVNVKKIESCPPFWDMQDFDHIFIQNKPPTRWTFEGIFIF